MRIEWDRVTWYSKLFALWLVVMLPFMGFVLGVKYANVKSILELSKLVGIERSVTVDGRSEIAKNKAGLIRLTNPQPNAVVTSPLIVEGQARGTWFFEATFPVVLTDWDGLIIAQGYAQARPPAGGDWMTEDFVPFHGEITFEKPSYSEKGRLILQRANPSGLPEYDDMLEIQILFE